MRSLAIIVLTFLFCLKGFCQEERLFTKDYKFRWDDSCNRKAKTYIEQHTDFRFDRHPLEWAQSQIDSNLLRTDTLFDKAKFEQTVYYYNKQNTLFLVKTTSTEARNWSRRISVYDVGGKLIFKEGYADSGNLGFRLRRGYYGPKTQFECIYFDTPMFRFWAYTKEGKVVRTPAKVCECNF